MEAATIDPFRSGFHSYRKPLVCFGQLVILAIIALILFIFGRRGRL